MIAKRTIRTILIILFLSVLYPWKTATSQNIFSNFTKDQGQIADFLSVDSLSNSVSREISSDIWFKSLDINQDDVEGFYNRALGKVRQAYFKEAIKDLDKIILLDTSISSVYSLKGYCQLMLNNPDSASININRAILLDNANGIAYYTRGRHYYMNNNYQSAKSDFIKSLVLNKNDPSTPYFLGIIALSEHDFHWLNHILKSRLKLILNL